MNDSKILSKQYRLAASCRGEKLILAHDVREKMVQDYQRRIARLESVLYEDDPSAFALSLEEERLARFFLLTGSAADAARAYASAAQSCLLGNHYDNGSEILPSRFMRMRCADMAAHARRIALDNERRIALRTAGAPEAED